MSKGRAKLQMKENFRGVFSGTFKRCGEKRGFNGYFEPTILLVNIRDINGTIVSDHLWFNYTKGFKELGEINIGDIIQFNARVKMYYKGYQRYREDVSRSQKRDYKLSHPTKISIIGVDNSFLEYIKKKQDLEFHQGKYEELNKKICNFLKSRFLIKRKSNVACQLVYIIGKKDLCYTIVDYNKELTSLSSEEINDLVLEIKNGIKNLIRGIEVRSFITNVDLDKKKRKKLHFKLSLY